MQGPDYLWTVNGHEGNHGETFAHPPYRCTRAVPPWARASTSASFAMLTSPGKVVTSAAVRPAQPQGLLGRAAGQQAVDQPGREAVAAADAAEHVQLHRGRGILPAVEPHHGRPIVAIGRVHRAERGGHHLDVGILLQHLLDQLEEGGRLELRLPVDLRPGQSQAALQVFLVAEEHVDLGGDAAEDLLARASPPRAAQSLAR